MVLCALPLDVTLCLPSLSLYTHISICHPLWIYALLVSLPLLMYALSVYHPLMIQPNIHHSVYIRVGGVEVGVGETVSFALSVLMLAVCTCWSNMQLVFISLISCLQVKLHKHSLVLVYAFSYTFLPTRDPSTLLFLPTEDNLAPPTLHYLPLTDELGRVRLKHSSGRGSDYINASFIDVNTHLHTLIMHTHSYVHTHMNTYIHLINSGIYITAQGYKQCRAYIATQYPLPGTVNDLWRMVWECNCSCIVLLCDISKNDKVQNRNTLGR